MPPQTLAAARSRPTRAFPLAPSAVAARSPELCRAVPHLRDPQVGISTELVAVPKARAAGQSSRRQTHSRPPALQQPAGQGWMTRRTREAAPHAGRPRRTNPRRGGPTCAAEDQPAPRRTNLRSRFTSAVAAATARSARASKTPAFIRRLEVKARACSATAGQ